MASRSFQLGFIFNTYTALQFMLTLLLLPRHNNFLLLSICICTPTTIVCIIMIYIVPNDFSASRFSLLVHSLKCPADIHGIGILFIGVRQRFSMLDRDRFDKNKLINVYHHIVSIVGIRINRENRKNNKVKNNEVRGHIFIRSIFK